MNLRFVYACALALPLLCSSAAVAQERTAGGAMDVQMSWTALSNLVKAASDKAEMVSVRVDQAVICGRKGMVYAPGATGADGDGCVHAATSPATNTTINNLSNSVNGVVSCGQSGLVYSAASNSCVQPSARTPSCQINGRQVYSIRSDACPGGVLVDMDKWETNSSGSTAERGTCITVSCN